MKGRKPKDSVLSVLDGGRGKRRQPQPVEIPTDFPAKPDHLEGEYAEVWGAVKAVLEDNGCPVRSSDVFSLEDLVTCIVRVRQLEAEVGSAVIIEGTKGATEKPCVASSTGISRGDVGGLREIRFEPGRRASAAVGIKGQIPARKGYGRLRGMEPQAGRRAGCGCLRCRHDLGVVGLVFGAVAFAIGVLAPLLWGGDPVNPLCERDTRRVLCGGIFVRGS